jgi:hypothetical protein
VNWATLDCTGLGISTKLSCETTILAKASSKLVYKEGDCDCDVMNDYVQALKISTIDLNYQSIMKTILYQPCYKTS